MSITSEDPAAQQRRFASDPATGEALGSVLTTPPERIDGVVEAVAKVQPLWALLRVKDRARYMRRMAQAAIGDFDQLQVLLAREPGRPEGGIVTLEPVPGNEGLSTIPREGG